MFSSKIQSKLDTFEATKVTELKDRALEVIISSRGDYVRCADELGISVGVLMDLRSRYHQEFREVEQHFLAEVEAFIWRAALGREDLKDKPTLERIKVAKWVLERKSPHWVKTEKLKIEQTRRPEVIELGPRALERLESYEREQAPLCVGGDKPDGE
jgi:hypothetical protein